jgi:hypothetical protein
MIIENRKRSFTNIEPVFALPLLLIGAMTMQAPIGKQRPNITIEINLAMRSITLCESSNKKERTQRDSEKVKHAIPITAFAAVWSATWANR